MKSSRQFASIFDITPLLLPVNGILLYLALFRRRLFDAHPVAYTHLFEQLNDGVLVFNMQGTVVDCNPAAYRLLGLTNPVGRPVQFVLQHIPQLVQSVSHVPIEELLRVEYNEQVLDVRSTIRATVADGRAAICWSCVMCRSSGERSKRLLKVKPCCAKNADCSSADRR